MVAEFLGAVELDLVTVWVLLTVVVQNFGLISVDLEGLANWHNVVVWCQDDINNLDPLNLIDDGEDQFVGEACSKSQLHLPISEELILNLGGDHESVIVNFESRTSG